VSVKLDAVWTEKDVRFEFILKVTAKGRKKKMKKTNEIVISY